MSKIVKKGVAVLVRHNGVNIFLNSDKSKKFPIKKAAPQLPEEISATTTDKNIELRGGTKKRLSEIYPQLFEGKDSVQTVQS